MTRAAAVGLCSILAVLLAPTAAQAATLSACPGPPALRFQVDRNTNARDRSLRTVDLRPGHGTSASSVKPVSLTIMRNGRTRSLRFYDLEDQYVYRARRGEQARFLAVYLEDSSGYGSIGFGQQQELTVPVPLFALLPAQFQALFPGGQISVLLPALSGGGAYGRNVCARALPLTVGEASTARRARTRRSF